MDTADPEVLEEENVSVDGQPAVANAELLVRIALHPDHIFKNGGGIKPSAFPQGHLLKRELSVTRAQRAGEELLTKVVDAIVRGCADQKLGACLVLSASDYRTTEILETGRCLIVLPAPLKEEPPHPENPAHAHIGCLREISIPDLKEIREMLIKKSKIVTSPDRVFDDI